MFEELYIFIFVLDIEFFLWGSGLIIWVLRGFLIGKGNKKEEIKVMIFSK